MTCGRAGAAPTAVTRRVGKLLPSTIRQISLQHGFAYLARHAGRPIDAAIR